MASDHKFFTLGLAIPLLSCTVNKKTQIQRDQQTSMFTFIIHWRWACSFTLCLLSFVFNPQIVAMETACLIDGSTLVRDPRTKCVSVAFGHQVQFSPRFCLPLMSWEQN